MNAASGLPRETISARARHARAGFSLVEILAVIVIIALLFGFLIPNLMAGRDSVKVSSTRTFLAQMSTEIESYEGDAGDYPPSTFPRSLDPKPTKTNMGIESLLIALLPADGSYRSSADLDDRLCNTDGDTTKTSHTIFAKSDAFEIRDPWDNPIVYLHRRDYEKGCDYMTYHEDAGQYVSERVTAAINPGTGSPYRQKSFQLLSAGPDGVFGTDDDIGNFDSH